MQYFELIIEYNNLVKRVFCNGTDVNQVEPDSSFYTWRWRRPLWCRVRGHTTLWENCKKVRRCTENKQVSSQYYTEREIATTVTREILRFIKLCMNHCHSFNVAIIDKVSLNCIIIKNNQIEPQESLKCNIHFPLYCQIKNNEHLITNILTSVA